MKSDISVVIPLYNKEKEIACTLRSVLAQTSQPLEIIVVDDGSTDGSAARVEEIGSPLIRLIQQENRGVSAARNRAMQEACGEYAALLDGDDTWEPGYLAEIERLIAAYPGCGAYATSFNVDDGHHLTPGDTPQTEGVVDFFTEALSHYVLIPSSTTLRRKPALSLGGFPEGMRLGEGSIPLDETRPHQPGLLLPGPARALLESCFQPFGSHLPPGTDAIFLRRPIRTRRPRFEQRIRRPRGTGQSPRRQRQRRHGGSCPAAKFFAYTRTTGVRCANSASSTHCLSVGAVHCSRPTTAWAWAIARKGM